MTDPPRKLVSVVVPLLNEQENIEKLYAALMGVLERQRHAFELLFIDDGSTDRSLSLIEKLAERDPRINYLSLSKNFGHQMAITAGLDAAHGDAVIVIDADLQHPPHLILQMLDRWAGGFEIVYTVRKQTKEAGALKNLSSGMFYRTFRFLTGVQIPEGAADFRLLDKKVVEAFRQIRERARFLRGLTHWVGFTSIGIDYEAEERHAGRSKYGFFKMLGLAIDGISSFSARPLVLSAFAGVCFALLGTAYLAYVLWMHFYHVAEVVPGWTSILAVLLFTSGTQMVFLGILGLYVGKIFQETKGRPLYLVKRGRISNSKSSS